MTAPAPHTMTTDELLRFHGDSPLAPALREALEQLEQAAKALTAARSLREAAGAVQSSACNDPAEYLRGLQGLLDKLDTAADVFDEVDDGELGA